MMRRLVLGAFGLWVLHFVLTVFTLGSALGSSMRLANQPAYQPTLTQNVASYASKILTQPAMALWTPELAKKAPAWVQWLLFVANSLLWAATVACVIGVTGKKRALPGHPSAITGN